MVWGAADGEMRTRMARIAIVTGSGGGLGREIARGLAEAGYGMVIADIDDEGARACRDLIRALGVPARSIQADVREPDDAERVVALAQAMGGPHVLVNNAGGWSPDLQYPEASVAEWTATLTLNLTAPMLLSQLVIEPMREHGGAIVNIASSAGIGLRPYGSPEYGAAKAGLIRFTSALAGWEKRYGIRMMCVAPDWVGLERAHAQWALMTDAERAVARPLIPPAQVVAVVLNLLVDGAGGTVVEPWGGEQPLTHHPATET